MTYAYTYRGKDGALEHGQVEAATRAEAFVLLKAQGVVPTALHEGRGHVPSAKPAKGSVPAWMRWSAVALAVAALGVAVWLALRGNHVPAPEPKAFAPQKAKTTPPAKGDKGVKQEPVPAEQEVEPKAAASQPPRPKQASSKAKGKNPAALLALQSSCKEGLDFTVDTNKVAELRRQNPTWAANKLQGQLTEYAIPGRFCGTPDPISDKEALALCDVKIEDAEGDSELVRAEKAAVRDLQTQLKQYLAEGGHANDFMMKLMERQDAEHEMMEQVKRQLTELCRSGDYDLAQEALDKYNAYLKGKGLPEVHTNPYMRHLLKVNSAAKQNP